MNFNEFHAHEVTVGDTHIFVRSSGNGFPLLLLHGFPQTHLMWRYVAMKLADKFTVVCADLPGYGRSGCPDADEKHQPYTKKCMAETMVGLMKALGYSEFYVAGHDRGARVAFRMALDFPDAVKKAAFLDIVPTLDSWQHADAKLALAFWPWTLLAQPAPLPEELILSSPAAVIDNALKEWGTPPEVFDDDTRNAYVKALSDPKHVHAICEEYRAAASTDIDDDNHSRNNNEKIKCPILVLWSNKGGLNTWYEKLGGPLALWRNWANDVSGDAIDGGHFFPEEHPEKVDALLQKFFDAH